MMNDGQARGGKMVPLAIALALFPGLVDAFTCPAYGDIRQPSVNSEQFDIKEFSGQWFMVATNEPTMPSFCKCGVNDVSIDEAAGSYSYTNSDSCYGKTVTLNLKGKLSNDPQSPGDLHETAAFFNHTIGQLVPNYVFRVERSSTGAIETLYTYACLGKMPPIVGHEAFSFNVLSRTQNLSLAEITAMVTEANRSVTSTQLDLSGLRINDVDTYRACGL